MATLDPGGAPAPTSGAQLEVTVTLVDSGAGLAFDYGGDVVHRDGVTFIEVPAGLHEVTFALKSDVARAFFLEHPIAWVDAAGEPTGAPPHVSLRRPSGNELVLTDANENKGPAEVAYTFFLLVLVDGFGIFGGDPILIDEPPPQ